jgi:subtilisin family serine protease
MGLMLELTIHAAPQSWGGNVSTEDDQSERSASKDEPERSGKEPEREPAGAREAGKRPARVVDVQVELVVRAFEKEGIHIGVEKLPNDDPDFLYQRQVILVRDEYIDAVGTVVGGGARVNGLIDGVTLYSLEGAKISEVMAALRAIDEQLGVGVAAPNHVLWVSVSHMCPATEPEAVSVGASPDPGLCPGRDGSGVHIYVPDTGLVADAATHPWLIGVTGENDPLVAPAGQEPRIRPYGGHGTFIAGVARCMAPVSEIHVTSLLHFSGAQLESEVVKHLDQALNRTPDIISLSAGTTSRRDRPPLAFEALWQRYRHYKGLLLVAAASNNGDRRPFWPAAFPQVVSVGALSVDWRSRASFSDYGGWVDVYAPGEGLVNAYATGTYVCQEPPHAGQSRSFHGMARWSGTSFATPLVSGLIAARMSRTGENSRRAADALLAHARAQALPGVGPVLYPCDSDEECRSRAEERCGHCHHCGCR